MTRKASGISRHISTSAGETMDIAEAFAGRLRRGDVIALVGELGSGKTVFVKGLAKGLGVSNPKYVNSPTFVIIKEHRGRIPLYHFDLYRLDVSSQLDIENYQEYFYGRGVCAIEWADKIWGILPKNHIEVRLSIAGENERRITIGK